MPKIISLDTLKTALTRERRTNRRLRTIRDELRTVIDGLREEVRQNRHDLDLQFTRIAQIQAQLDGQGPGQRPQKSTVGRRSVPDFGN